jgi:hypothetical protein
MKTVYIFDKETGIFAGEHKCHEYEPGKYMIPENSTEIEPGSCPAGKVKIWSGREWETKDNLAGKSFLCADNTTRQFRNDEPLGEVPADAIELTDEIREKQAEGFRFVDEVSIIAYWN